MMRFRRGVYANSKVSRESALSRVWEFTMMDGWRGYGEVVFPLSWPLDQYQKAVQEEERFLFSLVGKQSDHLMAAASQHRRRGRLDRFTPLHLKPSGMTCPEKKKGYRFVSYLVVKRLCA